MQAFLVLLACTTHPSVKSSCIHRICLDMIGTKTHCRKSNLRWQVQAADDPPSAHEEHLLAGTRLLGHVSWAVASPQYLFLNRSHTMTSWSQSAIINHVCEISPRKRNAVKKYTFDLFAVSHTVRQLNLLSSVRSLFPEHE